MEIREVKAKEKRDGTWYVTCPACRSRIDLDECPIPGGMTYNVEFCYDCGAEIEVQPSKAKN